MALRWAYQSPELERTSKRLVLARNELFGFTYEPIVTADSNTDILARTICYVESVSKLLQS